MKSVQEKTKLMKERRWRRDGYIEKPMPEYEFIQNTLAEPCTPSSGSFIKMQHLRNSSAG